MIPTNYELYVSDSGGGLTGAMVNWNYGTEAAVFISVSENILSPNMHAVNQPTSTSLLIPAEKAESGNKEEPQPP